MKKLIFIIALTIGLFAGYAFGGNEMRGESEIAKKAIAIYCELSDGIAPLEVNLFVSHSFTGTPKLDISGPGEPVINTESKREYRIRFDKEGIYTCRAEVTDEQGKTHSATHTIFVRTKKQLTDLLVSIWNKMKERLIAGNVDGAMEFFEESVRENYRHLFSQMAKKGKLAELAKSLPDPLFLKTEGPIAIFILKREEEGRLFGAELHFTNVSDQWKILSF